MLPSAGGALPLVIQFTTGLVGVIVIVFAVIFVIVFVFLSAIVIVIFVVIIFRWSSH